MTFKFLDDRFATSGQVTKDDLPKIQQAGIAGIICVRPDNEEAGQPSAAEIGVEAEALGLAFVSIPVKSGVTPSPESVHAMRRALDTIQGKILAYCRSGARASMLYELARKSESVKSETRRFDVVIAGGGAAGIATAASLLKRRPGTTVAIIDPATEHYYQPGWTLVGAGVFTPEQTRRSEVTLIPQAANWIRETVTGFDPEHNQVRLGDGSSVEYTTLVVALGIKLDWAGIEGLVDTLGKNGVTSNYRYDLAPYTWKLVQGLNSGTAIFTQPPMPIKCAGAPQKAAYLSCDAWRRRGVKDAISVEFDTCTPGLFGVAAFVPALMAYIRRYNIAFNPKTRLVKVDGASRIATFEKTTDSGTETIERKFDMLHVVPPQAPPDVVRDSKLADAAGWVSVDPTTLRHTAYANVFALGDCAGTSNAKTAAAVRKQAPVVAYNVAATLDHRAVGAEYDGYGACPLTVERGKIVLAEFAYNGALTPTLPKWLLDGQKPTWLAWFLKEKIMPLLYWDFMLRGREIMVKPKVKA
ncbi:bifunctional protein tyrosine phosphatase family protein/NAD(P)/FAD-dependent oxidoreductase [Brytella acorum]|uniref:TIGR01244 family sulfur transferase n=1 Tax=Brytella acorum TaxID=2959299 RepID=A0AA35Y2Q7_9PROT|nr:bifunctional protein tyrosine phosphatase family protein/NAD(P)/FAD-dependent oxidoreductase [Brytella acorum]MDF3624778.1 TIGR01244 family sulfur transferase [Brytella acorum]CAI9120081.1 TIGR01244 family sulfur transferase [Brytella acorum]